MISRSPISPPILFPGLTLGTKLDFHFDYHKVRGLAPVVKTLDSVIPIQWISIKETNRVTHQIEIYPVDSVIHLLTTWACSLIP